MSEDSLTTKILIEIRDAILTTNERLDQTRTELKGEIPKTNERLEQGLREVRSEIGGVRDEIVESETRAATRMVEHTAATRSLHELLAGRGDLNDRMEKCEREIAALKQRVG